MGKLKELFGRVENWPILIIPLLLMAWARFGATALGVASFDSATLYAGPYREALPPGPEAQPVVSNAVLVVIDGLRADTSLQLTTLNRLREQGASRIALAGQPSLSLPGWTVIGTGAWQETSGITSNYVERPVEIDTIFAAARRAGHSTAIVGSTAWDQLYGAELDHIFTIESPPDAYTSVQSNLAADRRVLSAALDLLDSPPGLMLVHFLSVDSAGHGFGGASPEYLQSAEGVDSMIGELVDKIDLDRTALIVTADHGHIDTGGHSGPEPVVIQVPVISAGSGIQEGEYPPAQMADLAPTIAALLGTSIPAHNLGWPLFDQLEIPAQLMAERAIDAAEQTADRYDAMLSAIGSPGRVDRTLILDSQAAMDAGAYEQAASLARMSSTAAADTWNENRSARLARERMLRAGLAILILIPVILYALYWRRKGWNGWAPTLGAAIYLLLWNANYHLVQDLTYSSSWFNTDEVILPFLTDRVIEALLALAIAVVVIAVLRRKGPALELTRDIVHTELTVAIALLLQILFFFVAWGVLFEWHLPNFTLGFKYYLDVFQSTLFWPQTALPAAILLPLLGLGFAWFARRLEQVLLSRV